MHWETVGCGCERHYVAVSWGETFPFTPFCDTQPVQEFGYDPT